MVLSWTLCKQRLQLMAADIVAKMSLLESTIADVLAVMQNRRTFSSENGCCS
jgi:hypothetical protein